MTRGKRSKGNRKAVKTNPARVFIMKENREKKRQMKGDWNGVGWLLEVLAQEKSQRVCLLISMIQERRNMP